ncbi:MAG: exo-alpha-sialidase, partial [Aquimonas sp.]|nr:exo-alpha-sialidase [Aquimonas sp.]
MSRKIVFAIVLLTVSLTIFGYTINDFSLGFTPFDEPSNLSGTTVSSNKVKILRVNDGTLFAVYGLQQQTASLAYDTKARMTRLPFDVVISVSTDNGATWGTPLNVSNTATSSSSLGIVEATGAPPLDANGHPDLSADPRAAPYPGDSDKPNVFNVGNQIVVTWGSTFCPGDEQRFVVYPELNGVTVPYSCLYVSRLRWNSSAAQFDQIGGTQPFITHQLTSGLRDVKQDANRGNSTAFVISWQEDPEGLKLGDAEGPGEGASGANVNNGTDIWFASLATTAFAVGDWTSSSRITRNTLTSAALSSANAKATHPPGNYDRGNVGASRANIGQISANVVIAYEETKGLSGFDDGKYVRYQVFPWNQPPSTGADGCIISTPSENARRVRFLTQEPPNATQLVFIYKQGDYTQGGPSDIFLRRATGGLLTPDSLQPPVDAVNCTNSSNDDEDVLVTLADQPPALNFSGSNALKGGTGTAPDATSGANPIENALAHRGIMRGNTIIIGYSYTPDLYRFIYLNNTDPYNFWIRRSTDGGATWSGSENLTPEITGASQLSVREPRIVPTPPSVASGLPQDVQNPNVITVAYGTNTNVREPIEAPVDVDIYMMVSLDNGQSWTRSQAIT